MNGEELKRQINDACYNDDMYSRYDLVEAVEDIVDENSKLRKYVAWLEKWALDHARFGLSAEVQFELDMARRELGVEVSE